MNNSIRPLILLLIALAGLLFVAAIVEAGINTLNGTGTIPDFFANAVIVIAGILATNFGAVVGVTVTPHANESSHTASFLGLRPSIQTDKETATANETDATQKLQVIACWVYVGGLLLAVAFYVIAIMKNVPDKQIVPLIADLSKTLLGVFVGALTVALGHN